MRHVVHFVAFLAIGLVAGLGALVCAPRLVGVTPFTILSGSMQPMLDVGDVVLDERITPLEARRGDVVTFPDQSRGGALVTHRVERLWREGAEVHFVTRGDANTAVERWTVPASGSVGRVRMHIPQVGHALQLAGSREGRLGLIAIPASLLVLLELAGLLRTTVRRPGEATA
jgi:signal peptidase